MTFLFVWNSLAEATKQCTTNLLKKVFYYSKKDYLAALITSLEKGAQTHTHTHTQGVGIERARESEREIKLI